MIDELIYALQTGDESKLRKIPEGRKYLLGLAKERRKQSLKERTFVNKAMKEIARKLDLAILEALKKGGYYG